MSLFATGYKHENVPQSYNNSHSSGDGNDSSRNSSNNGEEDQPTNSNDNLSPHTPPTVPPTNKVDRYGFLITEDSPFHRRLQMSTALETARRAKETQREAKWVAMLRRWKSITSGTNLWDVAMLNRRVRKGVPDSLRGLVWCQFLHVAAIRARYGPPPTQEVCAATLPAIVIEDISKDIDRTYPLHEMFMTTTNMQFALGDGSSTAATGDAVGNGTLAAAAAARSAGANAMTDTSTGTSSAPSSSASPHQSATAIAVSRRGGGQAELRLLLERYAVVDQQTGYCQGMSFVAAFLLSYMLAEDAYYAFISLMVEASYPLRALYQPDMYEMQKVLHVYSRLGKRYLGHLWVHLEEQGMHPSMYATEWFMCIYCRGFSFDLATRVMDIFVREGTAKILYRVALALLKSLEAELLSGGFEEIMGTLRGIAGKVDADTVLRLALDTIPLRTYYVSKYEAEFDRLHAAKKAATQRES